MIFLTSIDSPMVLASTSNLIILSDNASESAGFCSTISYQTRVSECGTCRCSEPRCAAGMWGLECVAFPYPLTFNPAQVVEYVKQEAKMVYLLECLQKTPPPVIVFSDNKNEVDGTHVEGFPRDNTDYFWA